MEPPPPQLPPANLPAAHVNYPDSLDSSPRSRNTDSWDEPLSQLGAVPAKLRLMCSYGGHIIPRPHDKSLCYVGGETRIVVVDRHTVLSDLANRLSKTLLGGRSFSLKYQLPNEELDSLISVTTDEDLENMVDEYDRLMTAGAGAGTAGKSSRLRVFLFPSKPESASSIGCLLENSIKSEDWFLNALNGANRALSDSAATVNCLLGLDDDVAVAGNANSEGKDADGGGLESFGNSKGVKQSGQDVHSVPDSPMMETRSSFGSTSSSPSLANLPPIRVHVEDQKALVGGIEEQFSQMNIGTGVQQQQQQDDVGFAPPATIVVSGHPMTTAVVSGEYSNRVFSDDERSDQGMSAGYRKPPQPQLQAKIQTQPPPPPPQSQPKSAAAGFDLASPDSVSSMNSDGSVTNPLSRQRAVLYQDHRVLVDPMLSDPNSRVQLQQAQDSGYAIPTQFEQQLQQQQQQQQQQLNPPQQQQQLNPPQQQQQQYIQAGTHYIQHHHHPSGAAPMTSYYPIYAPPPQQQQQYPVYYMPARQPQAYNLPMQQPNYNESNPQTPSPPTMIPTHVPKSEPPTAGVYRTPNVAPPSLVQAPPSSQQYVGYSQIHHPSQLISPNPGVGANYGYEFADPAHGQMYYTQALPPQMAAQYQTMVSAPGMMIPEASSQLQAMDNVKQQQQQQQQIKTSQP